MKDSHSPQVTGRSASPKGVRCTVWRETRCRSRTPPPRWPISTGPPSCSIHPAFGGATPRRLRCGRQVGGLQRVAREDVLDVHQQQLLVLLLMVQAQGDQLREAGLVGLAEQALHGAVDGTAVASDLLDAGTRQEAALGPGMAGTHRLVVPVEDVGVRVVERSVPGAYSPRMKVSKNHVTCARCHLVGLTSGMVWTVWSSALRTEASRSVVARTRAYASWQIGRRLSTGHVHEVRPFATPSGAVAHAGCTVRFTLPR